MPRDMRKAFRELFRMMRIDSFLRKELASLVKPWEIDEAPERLGRPHIIRDIYSAAVGDICNNPVSNKLKTLWSWNHLCQKGNDCAQFAAEIAYELENREPTKWKFSNWTTLEVSEYITEKILRQMAIYRDHNIDIGPWWVNDWMGWIFLGIGPWPVGDEVDDDNTATISTGSQMDGSFGLGPFPKGDGTG